MQEPQPDALCHLLELRSLHASLQTEQQALGRRTHAAMAFFGNVWMNELKFRHKRQCRVISPYFVRIAWRVPMPGGRSVRVTPTKSAYAASRHPNSLDHRPPWADGHRPPASAALG
jgi:hypothetical protein